MPTRVVVTGHDENGASIVSADREREPEAIGDPALITVTNLAAGLTTDAVTAPDGPVRFFPASGGVRTTVLEWAPAGDRPVPADYAAQRDRVLAGYAADTVVDATGLHASQTVDICFVLDGEITLELADGSTTTLGTGEVVVQNATAHRWSNRGERPCRMLVTMVGL
jgi:hypothetical protein